MRMLDQIRRYLYKNRWTIGFSEVELETVFKDNISIKWMKHNYHDRWFADPFILDVDDEYYYVLVEEYFDPIKRGRISLLKVNRLTYELESINVLLQLESHLSFPAIMRKGEEIFVYPENGASSCLNLYKLNKQKMRLEHVECLSDEPLADAILTDIFDEDLLFSTRIPTNNGNVLSVYKRTDRLYKEIQTIRMDSNIARNAGDWFVYKGVKYRPAQDCNIRYGGAVIIQEIKKEGQMYSYNNITTIKSDNPDYSLGLHTFNYYKGVAVFDSCGYRHPKLVRIADIIMRRK